MWWKYTFEVGILLETIHDHFAPLNEKTLKKKIEVENLIFILSIVGLESLSARRPGRRDTSHLTDLFQTFTVYEGQ